ncbi:MAG: thrombospondin type 3 repeat-containing protein [Verrucomicrobiaceae bacterium]
MALRAWIYLCATAVTAVAQIPAIPEPPIILYGTVTDKTNNQPVAITSVTWQVSDGTTNRSYSAATLPATRIIANGQSFYLLEVPQETRVVQNGAGQITLQSGSNGFEVKSPAPTYTLTATINGTLATINAVDTISQPPGTANAAITGYAPATQGRMMRVDLWINEDPYLAWAAGYFTNPNDPNAARTADPDHDGFTNEQEFAAGTDPLNGASSLRLANFSRAANGTSFSLTWASTPGKTYQVETSTALVGASWTSIGDPVLASGTSSALNVPMNAHETRRFFRVRVVP